MFSHYKRSMKKSMEEGIKSATTGFTLKVIMNDVVEIGSDRLFESYQNQKSKIRIIRCDPPRKTVMIRLHSK